MTVEGWKCPNCGAARSPHVDDCPCSPPQQRLMWPPQASLPTPTSTPTTRLNTPTTAPTSNLNTPTTASTTVGGKVLELQVPKPKNQPRRKHDYTDPGFQQFWEVYPYRVGKAAAYRKWLRVVVDAGVDVDAVVDGALRYRNDPNRNIEFTKYPEGWLGDGRWEDAREADTPSSHAIAATDWDAKRAEDDAAVAAILAEEASGA